MHYALFKSEDMSSAAFRGASPVIRATWMCLLAWCYEQENGGRIAGAAEWGDRRWQQTLAVTKDEVHAAGDGLWWWDGDDLVVLGYDEPYVAKHGKAARGRASLGGQSTSERKIQASRANGTQGGRPKIPTDNPTGIPTANPTNNLEIPSSGGRADGRTDGLVNVAAGVGGSGGAQTEEAQSPAAAAASQDHDQVVGSGKESAPEVNAAPPAREKQTVQGPTPTAIIDAIGRSLRFVVLAYRAKWDKDRRLDWEREAEGLSLEAVAMIFWGARNVGERIREPSGFGKFRSSMAAEPKEKRMSLARSWLEAMGLPIPDHLKATTGEPAFTPHPDKEAS